MTQECPDPIVKQNRQYDLEWIRAIGVMKVVCLHCAWLIACLPGFSMADKFGAAWVALREYVIQVQTWQMLVLFYCRRRSPRFSDQKVLPHIFSEEK